MSDDATQQVILTQLRIDPALADPSPLVKAFSASLNDRQGEAEKSTPETEWRRMRDLWGKLALASKAMTAMCRQLEVTKQLSVDVKASIEQPAKPKDDPFDPFNWPQTNISPPGRFPGAPGLTTTIDVLRHAASTVTQVALQSQAILDLYVPGIHSIAEDLSQLGVDTRAAIDALSPGDAGINSIDYGLITDGVTISQDYGLVADPPLSDISWGDLD